MQKNLNICFFHRNRRVDNQQEQGRCNPPARSRTSGGARFLLRILAAIAVGAVLGLILPDIGVRAFKTVNLLFAQILKFIVPLLILGLVTPAIADVGKGAGKMLVAVVVVSYFSTVAAGFFAYGVSGLLLPHYIAQGAFESVGNGKEFLPFFTLKMPPVCDVLTALALSFMVGVGIVHTGSESLRRGIGDFGVIVKLAIMRVIIPGLPLYIMTMISEMTASGKLSVMAGVLFKVTGTGWGLPVAFLFVLYIVAGAVAGRNPLACLWRMLPAYLTGLSIASSSAVIPVTLECCERNGISKKVRDFVVPLCANVHLAGSAIKLLTSAFAISILYGFEMPFAHVVNFIFILAIAAVAAPGVMGGVLMASVGFVESILGFTPEQTALLMTFYLALDGYGPAANVTADGAVALAMDRFFGQNIENDERN